MLARLCNFIGRTTFAFVFLASGFIKLLSIDLFSGGTWFDIIEPKMDKSLLTVNTLIQECGLQGKI